MMCVLPIRRRGFGKAEILSAGTVHCVLPTGVMRIMIAAGAVSLVMIAGAVSRILVLPVILISAAVSPTKACRVLPRLS